jgi:hypothetical protein
MFGSNNQPTRSLVVASFAAACVGLFVLSGCAPSKGPLGAADISELVERYKQAHETKDIKSLRAIYQRLLLPGPWGHRMVGEAEEHMPALIELELVDVELIEFPGEEGAVVLGYIRKRTPSAANGFSPIQTVAGIYGKPYKLLLVARRPGDPDGQVMEIDIGLGVEEYEGRLYLTAEGGNMRSVTEWVRTGRLPGVYRPPGHTFGPEGWQNLPKKVPTDWVRIVRPRS